MHVSAQQKINTNQLLNIKEWNVLPLNISVNALTAINKTFDDINYTESRSLKLKSPSVGKEQKVVYQRNESSIWDIPARLVYYKDDRLKQLIPAWEVQLMDVYKQHYWLYYISASAGKILQNHDLITHCDFGQNTVTDIKRKYFSIPQPSDLYKPNNNKISDTNMPTGLAAPNNKYRVFSQPFEHPNDAGAAHLLTTNSGDALGSPNGWHQVYGLGPATTYTYTHGNNVWAFQDPSPGPLGGVPSADPTRTAYNNTLIGGLPSLTEPFKFDYPFNAAQEPVNYMKAAIVNLFYWNNLMHDVYYNFGFTESAGNFQESNIFSSGLRGSATDNLAEDEILAQAQDGGGTNHANFLTLPDGVNGQMQMYLWTASTPDSLLQIVSSSAPSQLRPGTKFYGIQSSFSTLPTANNNLYDSPVINKPLIVIKSSQASTVGTETEGCSTGQQSIALPPANNVSGKIALIDRGECSFVEKVLGAQEGGAVGAVIINDVDGPPLAMGGSDAPTNLISIPAIMISKSDGDNLKALLASGASINGSLKRDTKPPAGRDGDLDNGVISHEYGHGISSRLTGGGTGDALFPLGGDEQGGEGWSDFCALYMTLRYNDLVAGNSSHPNGILPSRGIGNYVTYQPNDGPGIRPAPYSIYFDVNPLTFQNIDDGGEISIPHGVGSIWCEMLYEMLQNFIDVYGINDNIYEGANPVTQNGHKIPNANAKGNNIAMRLIIEGMKLQPTNPTFEDERDAILAADSLLYEGKHSCIIWKAFAKRGLGYSAQSNSINVGDEVESFDEPNTCNPSQKRIQITKTGPYQIVNHDSVKYTIKVTNLYPTPAPMKIFDTLASAFTYISATGNPVKKGKVLTWTIKLIGNQTKTFVVTVKATAQSQNTSSPIFIDDNEDGTGGWKTSNIVLTNGKWRLVTDATQAFSGSKYWFAPEVGNGGSNTALTSTTSYQISSNTMLVFTHKIFTEITYDGGVVEISEDGGATWNYLPASKFVSNGYNAVIPIQKNSNIGPNNRAAFTGVDSNYKTSVASLEDYAGKSVFIRFRMTSDIAGGKQPNGGWWIDDIELLNNKTDISNSAYAYTSYTDRITPLVGSNVYSTTTAILLDDVSANKVSNNLIAKEPLISGKFSSAVFPNPASTVVNVTITNPNAGNVSVKLFDNLGKLIATLKAGDATNINLPLNVAALSNGIYWVEVHAPQQSATHQLIIKR